MHETNFLLYKFLQLYKYKNTHLTMILTQKYFIDLLSQFYDKTTAKHPKRSILLSQRKKRGQNFQKVQELNNVRSSKVLSSSALRKSTVSSRSKAQSQLSNRSNNQQAGQKVRINNQQYFKCQWIYNSNSFVKSLIYGYLLLTSQTGNIELLCHLKTRFMEDYSDYFERAEIKSIDFYWNKIITISQKKEKMWEKQFTSSFQHFPSQFPNKLFQFIVKLNSQNITLSKLSNETIKKISQALGYGLNYYHVNKKFIRTEISYGVQLPFSLNVVYIQESEMFMVSDRQLRKPSQDEACEKIKQKIGRNIEKLLCNFNQVNSELNTLKSLQQISSQKNLVGNKRSEQQMS